VASPKKILHFLASLILALFLVMAAGAAKGLSPKEARNAIASIPGLEMDPNLVRVKSIGSGSDGAIVEAQFEIAFRLQNKGNWVAAEMRLADGKWEDLELIATAVRNEKIRRTQQRLETLSAAIDAYGGEFKYYPRARDIIELTDLLAPKYMNTVIRTDFWSKYLQYSSDGKSYRLQSLGPDGKENTGDEIMVESRTSKN
jgi:hypothetical protein